MFVFDLFSVFQVEVLKVLYHRTMLVLLQSFCFYALFASHGVSFRVLPLAVVATVKQNVSRLLIQSKENDQRLIFRLQHTCRLMNPNQAPVFDSLGKRKCRL